MTPQVEIFSKQNKEKSKVDSKLIEDKEEKRGSEEKRSASIDINMEIDKEITPHLNKKIKKTQIKIIGDFISFVLLGIVIFLMGLSSNLIVHINFDIITSIILGALLLLTFRIAILKMRYK
jgi:hypothetical protein